MTNKPAILVHVREYFWDIYQEVFSGVNRYEVVRITDFSGRGVASTNAEFHRHIAMPVLPATGWDEDEVIRRCRLLRNIPRGRALHMLRAMDATLRAYVEQRRWVAVMGQTVDDYVTHLLSLHAQRAGLPYLGLCSSYFPGYTQVTLGWNGAFAGSREVGGAEADAVLASVAGRQFRQDYNVIAEYNFAVHVRRVMRYWGKRVYFEVVRHARRAPWHPHFLLQRFAGQQKQLRQYPRADSFHADWKKRLAASGGLRIYLPLGHTPEAGTDYMIADTRFINYEATILRIARALGRHCTVIIKDHFHMLGIRDLVFYNELRDMEGVVLVPPTVNSNALLADGVDRVLVGAGSVGIEATIRGKAVLTFSDSAYWRPWSQAEFLSLDQLEQWAEQIRTSAQPSPSPAAFVRQCLATMLPFDYMVLDGDLKRKGAMLEDFVSCHLKTKVAPGAAEMKADCRKSAVWK